MKFRKVPVVIEATRWWQNGDHPLDYSQTIQTKDGFLLSEGKIVRRFVHPNVSGSRECSYCGKLMENHGWIDTLEGGHIVCPGDWIITGVSGEHYPCKNDIFEKTYEPEP